ncbi:MAG: AAA family ATPase [Actinomycetota bacterium]|nr:AAA family ATPase [Actinomycetota bacterium]
MEVRLFGPLEVSGPSGRLVGSDFPTRKCRQVLAALALARGRVVSKDRMADLLWRDRVPRNPAAAVEVAVSLLRSTLAGVTDERVIVTDSGGYRLDLAVVTLDIIEFDRLVDRAATLLPLEQMAMLTDALAVAGGSLLEDETGAEWAQAERDRARRRLEGARLDVAKLSLAHDDAARASALAERAWVDSDVVHEEAYAVGVAALVQLGRLHDARQLMSELEHRLVREEQREPSSATRSLRSLLHPPNGVSSMRAASVAVPRQFCGMELPLVEPADDIAEIEQAIAEVLGERDRHSGLVLIEGPSGIGKTRLLDMLAERLARRRPPLPVHRLRCQATDGDHPMLALGRLARGLGRAAGDTAVLTADDGAAAVFARLSELLDRLGPAMVLVDDIHLLDPSSVAVLASLLADDAGCAVCMLATRRPPGTAADPLPWALRRRVVHLSPLPQPAVDDLGIDGAWAECGGHPGTLAACCAADPVTGLLTAEGIGSIVARVDELGPLGMVVLGAAAALPQPFSATEVALATGVGAVAAGLLREAATRGVVRDLPGGRFEFAGAVVARALAAGRPAPRL